MADDSTTDSQLVHGSPISRVYFKKPEANWLTKLKLSKVNDPRRSQCIHQRKRENVDSSRLMRPNLRVEPITDDIIALRHSFSNLAWSILMKNKYGYNDALEQVTEEEQIEEEAFLDAYSDEYSDALEHDDEESNNNNKSTSSSSTAKPPEKPSDQKKQEDDELCPVCTYKMDATDLLFVPCSFCVLKPCLFCYTKINEESGVCPGCRNKYEQQTSSSNSGAATSQQPGGDSVIPLTSSFQGLGSD